jgi:glutaredoxin
MKTLALMTLLLLASLPAAALYKVVAPDGKVTYTDRPPTDTSAKVAPFGSGARSTPADADIGLPIELRQAAAKYPVTLYTAPNCPPCDSARQLLQQRGVPYTEKTVLTEEDAVAFEGVVGARTIPGAMIGPQALRGLSPSDWTAYLDAAGYPRESRLPRGWVQAPATPVVARALPAAPAPAPAPVQVRQEAAPAPAPASGIKF